MSIKSFLRGGKLMSENPNDPGHADFWCVDWNKKDTFYDPLPVVVLIPLIINALESVNTHDLDLNLLATSEYAFFDFYAYDSRIVLRQSFWPLNLINEVRDAFLRAKNLKKVFKFSFFLGG